MGNVLAPAPTAMGMAVPVLEEDPEASQLINGYINRAVRSRPGAFCLGSRLHLCIEHCLHCKASAACQLRWQLSTSHLQEWGVLATFHQPPACDFLRLQAQRSTWPLRAATRRWGAADVAATLGKGAGPFGPLITDNAGLTALHVAAANGWDELLDQLLKVGCATS